MATPSASVLARLKLLREEAVAKQPAQEAYKKAMRDVRYEDQPNFQQWLALPEQKAYRVPAAIVGSAAVAGVDSMRATPEQNPSLAWLAKKIGQADEFARKPFGYDNPPAAAISSLFGVPAIQRTMERAAYGEPLTNAGKANVPFLPEDTGEALMAAPQFISPMAKVAQLTKGLPVGAIIRNTGDNNFLKGSVENALAGLKNGPTLSGEAIDAASGKPLFDAYQKHYHAGNETTSLHKWLATNHPDVFNKMLAPEEVSVNKFVEGPLTRYVKSDMATPDDTVRALAEQGVLHYSPGQQEMTSVGAAARRQAAGFDPVGAAKTNLARGWENVSDMVPLKGTYDTHLPLAEYLTEETKADALRRLGGDFAVNNPHTPVYAFDRGKVPQDLGFDHLIDELRNALNPESGLPRNLLLTPEKLQNFGMERAVRHVAAINDWREQAALTARKAAAEGIPVRKEHEGGFRWLTVPDTAKDEKALKFACDVGKQGAWCTQGADAAKRYGSNGNQLHVLVDAKGDPHVQIMTSPGIKATEGAITAEQLPEDVFKDFQRRNVLDKSHNYVLNEDTGRYTPVMAPTPEHIVQIKGNSNFKPKDEYLPFVQDFVRSSKWSDVGDLQNTGLIKIADSHVHWPEGTTAEQIDAMVGGMTGGTKTPRFDVGELAKKAQDELGSGYITPDEYTSWVAKQMQTPGFAQGGSVYNPARVDEIIAAHRNSEYDPARVDDLVAQLKEEMYV